MTTGIEPRYNLNVRVEARRDGRCTVDVIGEIDHATAPKLVAVLRRHAGDRVNLDLRAVSFANAALLPVLDEPNVTIVGTSPCVRRLLELAGRRVTPSPVPTDPPDLVALEVDQLIDELLARAWAHGAACGAVVVPAYPVAERAARLLAEAMASKADARELLRILHPVAAPDHGDSWWATPLGTLLTSLVGAR